MLSISSYLSPAAVGGARPPGENTRPSQRDFDGLNPRPLQRSPGSPPPAAPLPPPENDAFTSFIHDLCLEARINVLVEPRIDPRLVHPAVFGAELRRAHATLRDAAERDPLMQPALQVVDEIVALNGATSDFRYALHLV